MPNETALAIEWALAQTVTYEEAETTIQVSKEAPTELVDKVREYFNTNVIVYSTFSFDDLKPYL